MSKLRIGWAEESITPNKSVSLVGQFAERISEYVEKPIMVTAMAIDNGTEQTVICSADLVGVTRSLTEAVCGKIAKQNSEIDPRKVIIGAIHAHTGPGYTGRGVTASTKYLGKANSFRALLEENLPEDKKYVEKVTISGNDNIMSNDELAEFLSDRIAKAAVDVWNNRKEGGFSNSFGRAAVGMCRRASYSDGSAQMWGDTNQAVFEAVEGGNDNGIELMFVYDAAKKLTGIVVNLACPAQCVQHRLFVSPDFRGEVELLLRKHFGEGLFVLPLCSAAGDQCPVDIVRWVEPESDVNDPNINRKYPLKRKADPSMFDLAGMKKVGRRIAQEVIATYEEEIGELQTDVEFVHKVEIIELPLRRATLADEIKAKKAIREYLADKGSEVDYNDAAQLQVHLGILRRMKLQDMMETVDTEVHIIRLGSIAIATNPFELFLDYGNKIKARSQTFLIQLANGTEGYLPTEKAEKGGHYSAFISSGQVGHEGGDLLVRNTLRRITGARKLR